MIKKLLKSTVGLLPKSVQTDIRERYWQTKSRFLYQSLYKVLKLENTLPSGITVQIASKGEWWIYNDIFVNGEYDVPILHMLEKASPDRPLKVLDLGANVGYFTFRVVDLIRQKRPGTRVEIAMVEGSSRVFADLKARMQSQILPELSSRLEQGLVGMRTGSASMRESAVHVKNTIMHDAGGSGPKTQFIDLSVLMENTDEIDLLKCDIEGAELLFLENYADLLAKIRHAVFELHHEQCDTAKCREILSKSGFRETVLRDTPTFSVNFMTRD